ncbi:MAG: rhodanese-like domain-containing protein [Desulfovibrionaceae bacterium]|nr:rhodanese-like domain-containing protein [Desulfovibrionaceae bacterium]
MPSSLWKSKKILAQGLVLVLAAAGLGVCFNIVRPHGLDLVPGPGHGSAAETGQRTASIDLVRALELFHSRAALFADSRGVHEFEDGHIPGAISLPSNGAGGDWARVPKLPKDRPVVTYCDGLDCGRARVLAGLLRGLGFDARALDQGLDAWLAAQGPLEASP